MMLRHCTDDACWPAPTGACEDAGQPEAPHAADQSPAFAGQGARHRERSTAPSLYVDRLKRPSKEKWRRGFSLARTATGQSEDPTQVGTIDMGMVDLTVMAVDRPPRMMKAAG